MDTATTHRLRWRPQLAWTGAALVLGATFTAYFSPDMAVTLANFVWSCFGG
jgi:hypothetical protein